MGCPTVRLRGLLLVAGLLVSAVPAAEPPLGFPSAHEDGFRVARQASLSRITSDELNESGHGTSIDVGKRGGKNGFIGVPELRTRIERELPGLWQLALDTDAGIPAIDVSYEVISENGRRGRLTHISSTDDEITVWVKPRPLELLRQEDDRVIVQGGVDLQIDLRNVAVGGEYRGELTTTINFQ